MRTLILTLLAIVATSAQAEVSQGVGVMGFQAWKASRLEEAKTQLEKAQAEAPAKPAEVKPQKPQESSRLQKGTRADQRLEQAQLNVEIAEELSVNDYFVLYLNQFKDRSAFMEAAQKLNSAEAAELLMAYQKHLATVSAPEATLTAIPAAAVQSDVKAVKR